MTGGRNIATRLALFPSILFIFIILLKLKSFLDKKDPAFFAWFRQIQIMGIIFFAFQFGKPKKVAGKYQRQP
jgi:hypothetical protein